MKITAADVGRQVRDGKGKIETIIDWITRSEYPVQTNADATYTEEGFLVSSDPDFDGNLAEFVDDVPDFGPGRMFPTPPTPPTPMAWFILGRLVECDSRDERTTLAASLLSEIGHEGLL